MGFIAILGRINRWMRSSNSEHTNLSELHLSASNDTTINSPSAPALPRRERNLLEGWCTATPLHKRISYYTTTRQNLRLEGSSLPASSARRYTWRRTCGLTESHQRKVSHDTWYLRKLREDLSWYPLSKLSFTLATYIGSKRQCHYYFRITLACGWRTSD